MKYPSLASFSKRLDSSYEKYRVEGFRKRHFAPEEFHQSIDGIVGTTIMRTRYVGLPGGTAGPLGYQLMLSFWAWGDTEGETMANLDRVLGHLSEALHAI